MKKYMLATAVIIAIYVAFTIPATLTVGAVSVGMKESQSEVLIRNLIGDLNGNIRCPVTGLSLNWASYGAYAIEGSVNGLIYSDYAIKVIEKMEEVEGYRIAQEGLERHQAKYWSKKDSQLARPLKRIF